MCHFFYLKIQKILFFALVLFLTSCSSYQEFEDGMTLFFDWVDMITPDHAVSTTINIEKTSNMTFYIIGENRFNINTEIRNNFTRRGFEARTAIDIDAVRQHIEATASMPLTNLIPTTPAQLDTLEYEHTELPLVLDAKKYYIVRYTYRTSSDDRYSNGISEMNLQIFDINGVDIVAEAHYRGKPYLHSSATRLMMEVFFWKWYEEELAERAKIANLPGPKPPQDTSNYPLGFFALFIFLFFAIISLLGGYNPT